VEGLPPSMGTDQLKGRLNSAAAVCAGGSRTGRGCAGAGAELDSASVAGGGTGGMGEVVRWRGFCLRLWGKAYDTNLQPLPPPLEALCCLTTRMR